MPYINEKSREKLDSCIDDMIQCLKKEMYSFEHYDNSPTSEEFSKIAGNINYCFSRILSSVMGDVAYTKIAIITGVLENIKQEFYRRVASAYEDKKIVENGDIKEYKKFPSPK
ncbi:hypothetical protein EBU24_01390 [bacterium]|nr:hypothetical protein [bacterium]